MMRMKLILYTGTFSSVKGRTSKMPNRDEKLDLVTIELVLGINKSKVTYKPTKSKPRILLASKSGATLRFSNKKLTLLPSCFDKT